MANNNYGRNQFLNFIQTEFEQPYFDNRGFENTGQNFGEFNGSGPNQRFHFFGFDPTAGFKINGSVPSSSSSILNPQYIQGSNAAINNNELKASDLLIKVSISTDENKAKIARIASEAMEELRKIALVSGEPLWRLDMDKNIQTLNHVEYLRELASTDVTMMELNKLIKVNRIEPLPRLWPENYSGGCSSHAIDDTLESLVKEESQCAEEHLDPEASREVCYIGMRPQMLIDILMNSDKWAHVFSDIVSKPTLLGVFANNGVRGSYEGTLQVMSVEYYVPSPIVPTRESIIARYCKKIRQGLWGVVDVSLEKILNFPASNLFRRRPSGCLIEEMHDGTSKIIWVEHVAVDNRQVHGLFQPMVACGFAFGAKRWIEILIRQCERSYTPLTAGNLSAAAMLVPAGGRVSMMRLAQRMVKVFCNEINASANNKWTKMFLNSPPQDPRTMAVKPCKDEFGGPIASTVLFANSFTLATTPPKRLFDFLRDGKSRPVWDVMSYGQYQIEELAQISTGDHPGNNVTLIQVKSTTELVPTLYLQESFTDSTGSYVIHAPLEITAATMLLSGGSSELVAVLPSGFIVHPDMSKIHGGTSSGSLLTIAVHIVDTKASPHYVPPQSIETMKNILAQTEISIKSAMAPSYNM